MRAGSSIVETLRGLRRSALIAIAGLLAAGAGALAYVSQTDALHTSDHDRPSLDHLLKTEDERSVALYLAMAAKQESQYTLDRMSQAIFLLGPEDDLIDGASALKFTRHLIEYRGSPDVLGIDFILDVQSYAGLMAMTIDRLNLTHRQDRPIGKLVAEVHDLSAMMFDRICMRLLQLEGVRYGEFRNYADVRTYLSKLDKLGCMT